MVVNFKKLSQKFRGYHFEFKHLTVLFLFLLVFQLVISLVNRSSITSFLNDTRDWYQRDAVEKIADLTATSLELTIESFSSKNEISNKERAKIIQSFNIIFSQQILQHNFEEICIFTTQNENLLKISDGRRLFAFLNGEFSTEDDNSNVNESSNILYKDVREKLRSEEQIISFSDSVNNLHVFVPFVIRGELLGALYMNNSPEFSMLSDQLIASHDETNFIYVTLILLGFISMYFISSYSVKERDEAQKKFLVEHEENIKQKFNYEKELAFTKRIYHTHHKAEKIMGFIKEDLNILNEKNIDFINKRVTKYSNFISRVIYDMKWFDPPVQTIRSPIYSTNLNEVLKFIVENIFLRVSKISDNFKFVFDLDDKLPEVKVNEFVIWELFEPLIQNAIEHGGLIDLTIQIRSRFDQSNRISCIEIIDNGAGIEESLLEKDQEGIQKIFLESVSTKSNSAGKGGYGCYIAYQIARRCGWELSASNNKEAGTTFSILVQN